MSVTRREFLGTSAAAGAAAALGLSWSPRAYAQDTADIRVAVIGFNGQGSAHIQRLGKNLVALCDADEKVLNAKADQVAQRNGGKRPETFTDFRKLLERKDIDAITTATPNHIHAWVTVLAAQHGKDVYCEKPSAHDIWEGKQMVAAAKKYGRIIQLGTQCRASTSLGEAAEFIRAGNLGKILYAVGTCYKSRPSIGKSDTPLKIPESINYDLWCGPAEKKDIYRPAKNSQGPNGYNPHYDWHWDWNTGNGDMGNQGIHQMDIARWFLGEPDVAPRAISIGGRLGYVDAGNTPNTQTVFLDYPNAPLIFETRGLPAAKGTRGMDKYRGSDVGVVVQCEKGHVLVFSYKAAEAFDSEGKSIKKWQVTYDELAAHMQNWLTAVAKRDPSGLNQPIASGAVSSALCHIGGISHQLGKPTKASEIAERIKGKDTLTDSFNRMLAHLKANGIDADADGSLLTLGPWLDIDPKTETFVKNDAANALRARPKQREGFAIPDVERETVAAAG